MNKQLFNPVCHNSSCFVCHSSSRVMLCLSAVRNWSLLPNAGWCLYSPGLSQTGFRHSNMGRPVSQ